MKKTILILFIYFFGINLSAQTPEWQWITQAGGTGWDEVYDMDIDNSGNIYITGYFSETIFFGSDSLVSRGIGDIFVAKLDVVGNWEWVVQAGGSEWDMGKSIAIDDYGNSYVTGIFSGTANFNSGLISSTTSFITSVDSTDIFVAKLDTNGNWEWVVQAGGEGYDSVLGIAIDGSDNLFITGRYYNSIAFGSHSLSNYGGEYYSDAFVAKLNSEGDWLWVSHIGGIHNDYGCAIAIDEEGYAIVTGSFEHHGSFGDFTLHSQGYDDIFVAKINTEGNWEWASQAGGEFWDVGRDVTISNSNIITLTGGFYNTAAFGSETIIGIGMMDIFISKLDAYGNWLSVSHAGGWERDYGLAITTDEIDNAYITGYFRETVFFDPIALMGNMGNEIFIAKLDMDNNWEWAISAGGSIVDRGWGIELDNSGNMYIVGRFMDVATFGQFTLISNGHSDIFIAKLDNPLSAVNELQTPKLALSNYPNPFNPKTNIVFNLQEESKVELDIYNIKGQKVDQLEITNCELGINKMIWNAEGFASGIYMYQLKVDGKAIASKRCLLLK